MLDDACRLIADMTEAQVKEKWPDLHRVIKCTDMAKLQKCSPSDPVPLHPVLMHEYEERESIARATMTR